MKYIQINGQTDIQELSDTLADSIVAQGIGVYKTYAEYTAQQVVKAQERQDYLNELAAIPSVQNSAKAKFIALGFTEAEASIAAGLPLPKQDVIIGGQG